MYIATDMKYKVTGMLLLFSLAHFSAQAQVGLRPLGYNPQIKQYLADHPGYRWNTTGSLNKWGTPDTLNLPFFEDFSVTHIYPDSSRWIDNNVFINFDLPVRPPSIGAATFDFLDPEGNPYSTLEENRIAGGDTLTSQYINLGGLDAGDSVIITFFYQPKGLGDFLTSQDSLKLQFRLNDSSWTQVWSVGGTALTDFKKVSLYIGEQFLTGAFQFRFTNRTYQWGNNNHWHLDYIYLDKNRTMEVLDFPDYAIQTRATSLLSNYYSMPYKHYLANTADETADSIFFRASNRSKTGILAQVRHIETWEGNVLVSTFDTQNVANISAESDALRRMKSYDFTGLTGDTVIIKRHYFVKESGITNPVLFQYNDSITQEQRFENYFAMDDGTAESSFGFNDLRNATGNMAIRFSLNLPDTLRAVSYFFTPNVSDPSKRLITLKIWQDIAIGGGTTQIIWDSTILLPDFNIDGFGLMTFYPGAIALPAGSFYVGWEQTDNFNISIGFDRNNGYRNSTGANQDIFYHVGDEWIQNSNQALSGAPMIRVFVGADLKPVSVDNKISPKMVIYPVPANNELHIRDINPEEWYISDITGKKVLISSDRPGHTIDVSTLQNGIYFLVVRTGMGFISEKFTVMR